MSHNEFETANPLGPVAEKVKQLIGSCNNNEQTNFDVMVLGVGSMGSSTCYYLAKQGEPKYHLVNERFDYDKIKA